MISQISFNNFKSWKTFPETKLGNLSAFFGTNSSGKTSLLDFILLLKQTLESSDRSQAINLGNETTYAELGSFDDMIYKHKADSVFDFEIQLKFEKKIELLSSEHRKEVLFTDDVIKFKSSIRQTKRRRVYVDRFSYIFDDQEFIVRKKEADRYDYSLTSVGIGEIQKYNIKRTTGRNWDLTEPTKFHGFPDQVQSYFQNAGFLFDLQLSFEKSFENIYYLGPLREYPKRQYTWTGSQPSDMGMKGERCIEALLASRLRDIRISPGFKKRKLTVEEYVAKWLKDLGLIHSFRIVERDIVKCCG